jgi:molybdate transport system regulatory protein
MPKQSTLIKKANQQHQHSEITAQFRLRVKVGTEVAIGPGKIAILEAIAQTGSISAAGRKLGMSYRRAWLLVDQMNHYFKEPVVQTINGGTQGGGTTLTKMGLDVIKLYRDIERQAETHSALLVRTLAEKIHSN